MKLRFGFCFHGRAGRAIRPQRQPANRGAVETTAGLATFSRGLDSALPRKRSFLLGGLLVQRERPFLPRILVRPINREDGLVQTLAVDPEISFRDRGRTVAESVFRKPFSAEELALIVEAAKADPFIYPLIVTGISTAMRRGDCCTLLREAVDMEAGFATVKASKTGETVQIPIFPLFRGVLEKALAQPSPRVPHYVFPDLEAHYRINPDHLTDRVRRVMQAAGLFDPEDDATEEEKKKSRGALSVERKEGLRKASLRDFHSFRVTWVTIALTAGVPMEVVRKVTGHRTAEIVMKHYFQPGREDFRRTLAGKLPGLLGGGSEEQPLGLPEIRERLAAMAPRTWRKIRDELIARLPAPQGNVVEVVSRPPAAPAERRAQAAATRPAIDVSAERSESPPAAAVLQQSG